MIMKTRIITIGLLALLLSAGVLIAGCMTSNAAGDSSSLVPEVTKVSANAKILKMADLSAITSLDPAYAGVFITEKAAVTEPLVGANRDFTITPQLAKSWNQTSPTTWEFYLRDDVKFHNGKPLTADAVKFSLDRIAGISARDRTMMDFASSRVINDHTIEVTTNNPNPILPAVLHYSDMSIIHPDSLNAQGTLTIPIGTGPMMYDSFDEQTRIFAVKKNPEYWGGTVKLDGIVFTSIPDHNSRTLAIEKGDVDFTVDIPYNEMERVDALPGINIEKYLTPRVYRLIVNFDHTPFQDVRVRKAISLAINRTDIVNHVLYGVGGPAKGIFTPDMAWSNKNLDQLPYDPEQAKALLAEAGYTDTDGDGIVEKDGQPFVVNLIAGNNRPGLPPMAETIGADLKAIGIQPRIEVMTSAAATDRLSAGSYDLNLIAANIAMVPDPAYIVNNWYTTKGPDNNGHYKNATLDAMIHDASQTTDLKERYAKFNVIEADVNDYLPTIPIADYGVAIVKKDTVTGYKFDPTAHDFRLDYNIFITG
jgi:peptide/nickel transport system substrate-binding protein